MRDTTLDLHDLIARKRGKWAVTSDRELIVTPFDGCYGRAGYVIAVNGSPPRGVITAIKCNDMETVAVWIDEGRSKRMGPNETAVVDRFLDAHHTDTQLVVKGREHHIERQLKCQVDGLNYRVATRTLTIYCHPDHCVDMVGAIDLGYSIDTLLRTVVVFNGNDRPQNVYQYSDGKWTSISH